MIILVASLQQKTLKKNRTRKWRRLCHFRSRKKNEFIGHWCVQSHSFRLIHIKLAKKMTEIEHVTWNHNYVIGQMSNIPIVSIFQSIYCVSRIRKEKPYKFSGTKFWANSGQLVLFSARGVNSSCTWGQIVIAGNGASHTGTGFSDGLWIIGFSFIVLYAW